MPMSPVQQEYYSFLEEYTAFLGRMLEDEKGKLQALLSKDLPRIEHSITNSQANAKQLENYEIKRSALQAKAGYAGQSFRQIIAAYPSEMQSAFWQLYDRFERCVGGIRFHNDKSMAVARDNMVSIDPSAVLPHTASGVPTNPYSKIRQAQDAQANILETKI